MNAAPLCNAPQTIHWLRHGCLPLFVIEGSTPPAKIEKLRQRCVAVYGPVAGSWRVGNSEGGRFASLGRKVAQLLDFMVGRASSCWFVNASHLSTLCLRQIVALMCCACKQKLLCMHLLGSLRLLSYLLPASCWPHDDLISPPRLQGVPWVQATGEGEATCAALNVSRGGASCLSLACLLKPSLLYSKQPAL